MAAWGEALGKVQVMPGQHVGREDESVSHRFFCLLLASRPYLGNPLPSTPESSHPVPDPAPRTRSLHRPAQVPRPDPGTVARRLRPPVLRAARCPARAGEGTLPGQVSGFSTRGQQEPTAAQRPRGLVRPAATPRRGPPARSA